LRCLAHGLYNKVCRYTDHNQDQKGEQVIVFHERIIISIIKREI
jgi:hypothetical protein